MLEEIPQVHRQPGNVVPAPGLFGVAVSAQVGHEDMVALGEGGDVAFENCAGAGEAV